MGTAASTARCRWLRWGAPSFEQRIAPVISALELTAAEKQLLRLRFVGEVTSARQKSRRVTRAYLACRTIVSMASIILPAVISVKGAGDLLVPGFQDAYDRTLFWLSVMLSLTITVSNAVIQMYGLDRYNAVYSLISKTLESAGWQFLSLSGQYAAYDTHRAAFKPFSAQIEVLALALARREAAEGQHHHGSRSDSDSLLDIIDHAAPSAAPMPRGYGAGCSVNDGPPPLGLELEVQSDDDGAAASDSAV